MQTITEVCCGWRGGVSLLAHLSMRTRQKEEQLTLRTSQGKIPRSAQARRAALRGAEPLVSRRQEQPGPELSTHSVFACFFVAPKPS